MSDLLQRIEALTRELQAVNTRIETELRKARRGATDSGLFRELDLLIRMKEAVDEARHLLWPAILAAQQHAESNAERGLQHYRMERIRKMLTAVQSDPSDSVKLFLAEVQRLASKKDE